MTKKELEHANNIMRNIGSIEDLVRILNSAEASVQIMDRALMRRYETDDIPEVKSAVILILEQQRDKLQAEFEAL